MNKKTKLTYYIVKMNKTKSKKFDINNYQLLTEVPVIDVKPKTTTDILDTKVYKKTKLSKIIDSVLAQAYEYGHFDDEIQYTNELEYLFDLFDEYNIIAHNKEKNEFKLIDTDTIMNCFFQLAETQVKDGLDELTIELEDIKELHGIVDENIIKCLNKFDYCVTYINGQTPFDVNLDKETNIVKYGLNDYHNIMFRTKTVSNLYENEFLLPFTVIIPVNKEIKDMTKGYKEIYCFVLYLDKNKQPKVEHIKPEKIKEMFLSNNCHNDFCVYKDVNGNVLFE